MLLFLLAPVLTAQEKPYVTFKKIQEERVGSDRWDFIVGGTGFYNADSSDTEMWFQDSYGVINKLQYKGVLDKGIYVVNWDWNYVNDLNSGMYLLRIKMKNETVSKKMLLAK